jgi:hypothetical protein
MLRLWSRLKCHCFATVWVVGGAGGRAGGGRGRGLLSGDMWVLPEWLHHSQATY